jgi:transposase
MSKKRYTEEFKLEAVKQVTDRGHAVADVAARLGISSYSLYQWIKRHSVPAADRIAAQDQQGEIRRLKSELKRVTEERDILKKAAVGSIDRCNTCFKSICGRAIAQGLPGSLIQA